MPAIPYPSPENDGADRRGPWDILVLDERTLPGLCRPSARTKHDFDVKKAKGKAKAPKPTDNGTPPREPEFDWEFTEDEWDEVLTFLDMLDPRKPGAAKTPVSASHPLLAIHRISTVIVQEFEGPTFTRGLGKIRIKLLEVDKQTAQKGVGGNKKKRDTELAALIEQAKEDEVRALVAADFVSAQQIAQQRAALEAQMGRPSNIGPLTNF
jgi:hypothetical protein